MTENVLVRIKGLQMLAQDQEDETELVLPGKYREQNGTHYITYEEFMDDMDGSIKSLVKCRRDRVEVTRRGLTNVQMIFEKGVTHETPYRTPFGELMVGIRASELNVVMQEDEISVNMKYKLDINYDHMADCTITMKIQSMEQ